jgi:antitoxin VapB
MGLNIKNERVEKLARDLADATGETMTAAIGKALQERLDRVAPRPDAEEKIRRVREILARIPPPPPGVTSDHSDLYNEHGEFDDS